ncbi:TadE/TadG family type IV pilus assembly protein [Caulobacter mirabilis]|uniref:Pilus assembly protein TadE n=1 Tax=Caulobacter mirabilis TaxID=69666 RepID=A0A2D2ASI4_9CAUL|nr:TadE/TadG family type IV pilus assembly protein [Caulobacter mirabilis]ATQ40943.1 pilus assembly protein TadE [Caulobacter mirabilis]
MTRFPIPFLKRLARDRRGVSAVEFALIAPAMIAFYFGMAEVTQALLAERRAGHVASAVGDLVTQTSNVNQNDIDDIFAIATTIMRPFPAATELQIRVTSISSDASNVAKVDWSKTKGMTALAAGSTIVVPSGVLSASQSVVMSEVTYSYDSPVNFFIPNAVTFTRKFYLRPRKSDKVLWSTS